jgi:lipopolysaccharide export system protein LptA
MSFSSINNSVLGLLGIIFLMLMASPSAEAQKRVKIKKADYARGGRIGDERIEKLIGNVVFVQNNTTIYCDSAYFYKRKNSVEAFGHVHIVEGDSIDITGSRLEYNGDSKLAKLRRNVVFTKLGQATLYTDNLDYSRPNNLAYYFNGGKLVDSANVLTSNKGYYLVNRDLASFKKNVKVVNPDYTMTADSLQYNARTKVINFVTETTVVDKDSAVLVYREGVYNTRTKRSDIKSGTGESEDYMIVGDNYDYNGILQTGKVRGNVVMTSKKESLKIYGQASDYFKTTGVTKVYNNAYIAKVTDDNDTLYISADTLVSIDDKDPTKDRLLAYHNVKIYKTDMQGKADSLEYRASDSTIYFYKNPVLWSEGNQMTADSISMLIEKNTVSKVFLVVNAFVISQDTLLNFNQIKGRRITAELANSKINKVYVAGNGESLFYALDDKNQTMMGMNKILCSSITIRFKQGQVNNLSFYVKPDAKFIPPHELQKGDKTLKGFNWKAKEKPQRKDVVKTNKQVNPSKLPTSSIKKTAQ